MVLLVLGWTIDCMGRTCGLILFLHIYKYAEVSGKERKGANDRPQAIRYSEESQAGSSQASPPLPPTPSSATSALLGSRSKVQP